MKNHPHADVVAVTSEDPDEIDVARAAAARRRASQHLLLSRQMKGAEDSGIHPVRPWDAAVPMRRRKDAVQPEELMLHPQVGMGLSLRTTSNHTAAAATNTIPTPTLTPTPPTPLCLI